MIGHPMVTSIIMIMGRNVQHFFGRTRIFPSMSLVGMVGGNTHYGVLEKNIFLSQGRLAIYMI